MAGARKKMTKKGSTCILGKQLLSVAVFLLFFLQQQTAKWIVFRCSAASPPKILESYNGNCAGRES